jgi:RNA polymerase sigma-70 factor (ECF subfamily)
MLGGDARTLDQRPDDELVAAVRVDPTSELGGAAASVLLQRYAGRVHAWCMRYVRDHDLALDLAQDVLIRAYQGLPNFDGRAPFSAWLFVIVRNRCLRAMRKPSWTVDDAFDLEWLADPAGPVDERLESQEEHALILELMDRHLEPLEREALLLRCIERMPVAEITDVLAIDHATGARAVLQTARRKLRAALERHPSRRKAKP